MDTKKSVYGQGDLFSAIKTKKNKILEASLEDRTTKNQREELDLHMRSLKNKIKILSSRSPSNRKTLITWELELLEKVKAFELYSSWQKVSSLFPPDHEYRNISVPEHFYNSLINCDLKEVFLEKLAEIKPLSEEDSVNYLKDDEGMKYR